MMIVRCGRRKPPSTTLFLRNSRDNHGSALVILTLGGLSLLYFIFGIAAVSVVWTPTIIGEPDLLTARRILRTSSNKIPPTVNRIETNPIREWKTNFPVHTHDNRDDNDSWEDIPHPGIAFSGLDRIRMLLPENASQISETIRVPKFWNPPQFGVRSFWGNNGRRVLTREEAQLIGSVDPQSGKPTIFVSVASYRDSECTLTLESIYARAKYPDRIRVAVVDQIDVESPDDIPCGQPPIPCGQDPHQVLCKYAHLIDEYQAPAFLMVGPVFARHIGHRMYRGEHYALQVDAHVRFVQDWDDNISQQWESTHNEMAVLSTYLSDIDRSIDPITNQSRRKDRNILCRIQYDGAGLQRRLTLKQPTKQSEPSVHGTPLLHPFWSAGFSFSRGHFIVSVPYDQYLPMIFQGEEATIALRGFTYGYDFYAPEQSVAFHIYAIKGHMDRRGRHKFWENDLLFKGSLEKSTSRMNGITGLLGQHDNKTYFSAEEDRYGLGHVRSKEKYFETFGIHPETETVEMQLCNFVDKDMHQLFTAYLRKDGMGIDYNKINYSFHGPNRQ